MHLVISNLI